jgi:hypothetical protein
VRRVQNGTLAAGFDAYVLRAKSGSSSGSVD